MNAQLKNQKNQSLIQSILESDNEAFFKEGCESCNKPNCVIQVKDYVMELEDGSGSLLVPAWICQHCGNVSMTDDSITIMLNHLEVKEGRPYSRVRVKNRVVMKYNIH